MVMVRDKRQRGESGRAGGAAHQQGQGGAVGGVSGLDIAHRDWAVDRGAKAAAGDPPDRIAGGVDDRRRLARWRAAVGADADPLARRPFGELAQNDRVAGEAALGLSSPADGPGEIGLDRGCGFVDVVPV